MGACGGGLDNDGIAERGCSCDRFIGDVATAPHERDPVGDQEIVRVGGLEPDGPPHRQALVRRLPACSVPNRRPRSVTSQADDAASRPAAQRDRVRGRPTRGRRRGRPSAVREGGRDALGAHDDGEHGLLTVQSSDACDSRGDRVSGRAHCRDEERLLHRRRIREHQRQCRLVRRCGRGAEHVDGIFEACLRRDRAPRVADRSPR